MCAKFAIPFIFAVIAGIYSTITVAKEPLPIIDQLIPATTKQPNRVIIMTAENYLGDTMLSSMALIPRLKEKYGRNCEIVFISPWANTLKNENGVTPVNITRNQIIEESALVSNLVTSHIRSSDDLLIVDTFSLRREAYLYDQPIASKLNEASYNIQTKLWGLKNPQATNMDEFGLQYRREGEAFNPQIPNKTTVENPDSVYSKLLVHHRKLFGNQLLPEGASLQEFLVDSQSTRGFYKDSISGIRVTEGEQFILLNLNGGPDKDAHLTDYASRMIALIKKIINRFPQMTILVTSPQDIDNATYKKNLASLYAYINEENHKFPRIGTLDHKNIPALSRAIEDAKLIITQDTGLAHMATQRRGLLGEHSKPEVISLSFTENTYDSSAIGWRNPSQIFLDNFLMESQNLSSSASHRIEAAFDTVISANPVLNSNTTTPRRTIRKAITELKSPFQRSRHSACRGIVIQVGP